MRIRRLVVVVALVLATLVVVGCQTAPVAAAAKAPDRLIGTTLSLSAADLRSSGVLDVRALRGQVVIVDFWASWCAPCRLSLPYYQELYAARAKDGLQVIGISIDVERALAERFLTEVPTTFAMAWDADQRLAAALQLETMPTAIVVDRAGVVRAVHQGFVSDDKAAITELVGRLLAEPAPTPTPSPG